MRLSSLLHQEASHLLSRPIYRLAMVVVMLIPVLYGGLFLSAFWDPYSKIDEIPVALVDLDRPAMSGAETVTAGADLARELLDTGTFAWDPVTPEAARRGLDDGTYYLALTIPSDFSSRIVDVDSDGAERADLLVTAHESKNMLATQIGGRVFTEVRSAASASASRKYFDSVFLGFADARSGLVDAARGADDLASGLSDADGGVGELADGASVARAGGANLTAGLTKLERGATVLAEGTGELASGATALSGGTARVVGGTQELAGGARKLSAATTRLAEGMDDLAHGSSRLATASHAVLGGATQVDAGVSGAVTKIGEAAEASGRLHDGAAGLEQLLAAYIATHPEAGSDAAFVQAQASAHAVAAGASHLSSGLSEAKTQAAALSLGSHQVAAGADALWAGATALDTGIANAAEGARDVASGAHELSVGGSKLEEGIGELESGARTVASGAGELALGSRRLASGVSRAEEGAGSLADGLKKLDGGASRLASGFGSAVSGSEELASGLTAGVDDLPELTDEQRTRQAELMSDPVALETKRQGEIPNYGTGFSPYFIPLSLWVGGLVVYFVLSPLPLRSVRTGAPAARVALSGLLPGIALAAAQATILVAVLRWGLDIDPVSQPALLGFVILIAVVFSAILQWLSSAFGPAGKLLTIVLLMLQITSAGGTFPLETAPAFFRAISPFLPMTYAVSGLREAISGGDWSLLVHDSWVLLAFGAACFVGTALAVPRARTYEDSRLKPTLQL